MYKFPAVYLLLGNGLNGRESQEPGREKKKKQLSDPFPPRFQGRNVQIVNVQKFGSADSLFPRTPVFVNWKVWHLNEIVKMWGAGRGCAAQGGLAEVGGKRRENSGRVAGREGGRRGRRKIINLVLDHPETHNQPLQPVKWSTQILWKRE